MKFVCSQSALSKAIGIVSKAVSIRTTIPILKGILLTVKEDRLTLSASDLDMSIETSIDVQNAENGAAVVSARLFGEIVRKLPNALIKVEHENEKLKINCLGSDFSIVSLPAEEFPIIKGIESKNFIDVNKNKFIEAVKKTVFTASIDEKKGILTGVLLNFNKDGLELVALDGFRMGVSKADIETNIDKNIIVPARILNEINKILIEDEGSDTLSLLIDEKKIEVLTEETRVVARLLEGDFIKYKEIIPNLYRTRVIVNREDMLSGIERASLLREGKSNLVKIIIEEASIDITSKSEEGSVNEHIGADVNGENLVIGFNSKYLIDVLKAVSDEELVFEMGTSVSACIIKPVEADSFLYLVLPVRISAV